MPGIVALRDAISTDVIAALVLAGSPPLVDGQILLGPQHKAENSAPPRIILIPKRSDFTQREAYSASTTRAYTLEQIAQNANPPFYTDKITFEARVWSVDASNNNPDGDYDATQLLYHQLMRSCFDIARGSVAFGKGDWTDVQGGSTVVMTDGREFVFTITFDTPVLKFVEALVQAPADTILDGTVTLENPAGATGSVVVL